VEDVAQSFMTEEEQSCEQHFISNTFQHNRRYEFRLPTKMGPKQLASSRLSAEQKLLA